MENKSSKNKNHKIRRIRVSEIALESYPSLVEYWPSTVLKSSSWDFYYKIWAFTSYAYEP